MDNNSLGSDEHVLVWSNDLKEVLRKHLLAHDGDAERALTDLFMKRLGNCSYPTVREMAVLAAPEYGVTQAYFVKLWRKCTRPG